MRVACLLLTVLAFAPARVGAQAIPEAALAAESAGRWDEAIADYRAVLDRDPARAELWVRIGDIEARRGDIAACIRALEQAVAHQAASPILYERLSQAYASAGRAIEALRAIEIALTLQPEDQAYLRARATLATWAGEYRVAQESYRTLASRNPTDAEIALQYARVSGWSGDTDGAVREYRRYLVAKPDDAAAWLELSRVERWRGNFAAALDAVNTYRTRFGTDASVEAETAAILAAAGRPLAAERVLAPLLVQAPTDYDLLLTHTLALADEHRSRDAFASLDTVRNLSPQGAETTSAERVLRTLLASSAESPFSVYSDSDALQIARFAPRATVALQSGTTFSAGYERAELSARAGTGLQALDGSPTVSYEHTSAGAAQRFGVVVLNGQVGYARTEEHTYDTYGVGVDARLADSVRLSINRAFAPFVVSPRTVSLGITAMTNRLQLDWSPSITSHVAVDGAYYELSDGNRRWELTVSPRVGMARTSLLNLDVGVSAYRLETAYDLANGYYDPRRYESYEATVYPYFKIRESVGVAVSLAAGAQRDSESPSFHFGGNATAETSFGIYDPWVLKVSGTATLNERLSSGAFRGFGAAATLVRRF